MADKAKLERRYSLLRQILANSGILNARQAHVADGELERPAAQRCAARFIERRRKFTTALSLGPLRQSSAGSGESFGAGRARKAGTSFPKPVTWLPSSRPWRSESRSRRSRSGGRSR